MNKGNVDVIDELFSGDFIDHSPGPDSPTKTRGSEGIKKYFEDYLKSFTNLSFIINDIIAEQEKVIVYVTAHVINTGSYMDFRPSNKQTEVTWVIMFRIVDGKIIETWDISNENTLYKNIGVKFVQD